MAAEPVRDGNLTALLVRGPRLCADEDDTRPGQPRRDIDRLRAGSASRPGLLVVTGKLTEGGLPAEFRRATELISGPGPSQRDRRSSYERQSDLRRYRSKPSRTAGVRPYLGEG